MVQTKALYNMLRMSAADGSTVQGKPWAVEQLRALSFDELWNRLKKLGIQLDKTSFAQFSTTCTTPEEFADILVEDDEDPLHYDQIYLLIFELWRRLFPEKASLSIFADELDHQIGLYVQEAISTDEPIQNALARLSDILDEHIDAGMKPKEAFSAVSDYCANDLESFIYLYISDMLDQENPSYSEELLEEFSPYFPKQATFDVLKVRLTNFTDPHEANQMLHEVLLKKQPLPLLLDILQFLVASGEHELFIKTVRQIFIQLKTEEDLQELLDLTADYFARLDKDDREQAILAIKERRQAAPHDLNSSDPDLAKLKDLLLKA